MKLHEALERINRRLYASKDMPPGIFYTNAFFMRMKQDFFSIGNGDSVLDIGCGKGALYSIEAARRGAEVAAIDIDDLTLRLGKTVAERCGLAGRITFYKQDVERGLDFKDNTFDKIIASQILEHLADDISALTEMKRVLKRGGTLYLGVPNMNSLDKIIRRREGKPWLSAPDHKREYTYKSLEAAIKRAGFNRYKVTPVGFNHPARPAMMPLSYVIPFNNIFNPLVKLFPHHSKYLEAECVK